MKENHENHENRENQNKVVITGASRGLGKKIAEKFLASGSDIAIVGRNRDNLQKLIEELKSDIHRNHINHKNNRNQIVDYFVCDLANLEIIPALIEEIKSRFGDPDILVNNAGLQGPIGVLQENDWEEWQKCLNVNLLAPVLLCRRFVPAMIKNQYGRIINISGGGATKARPNFTSYATSKCGLVRFTETLAEELKNINQNINQNINLINNKDYGVYANCVAPGAMRSEMTCQVVKAGIEKAGECEYRNALKLDNLKPDNLKLDKLKLDNLKLNSYNDYNDYIINRAADLVLFLVHSNITGKLISAVWDPWCEITQYIGGHPENRNNDIYTLRRIVPKCLFSSNNSELRHESDNNSKTNSHTDNINNRFTNNTI